jgi:hypothetical protein
MEHKKIIDTFATYHPRAPRRIQSRHVQPPSTMMGCQIWHGALRELTILSYVLFAELLENRGRPSPGHRCVGEGPGGEEQPCGRFVEVDWA